MTTERAENFDKTYRRLTAEIADVEKKISDKTKEFENVRQGMLTGLFSCEGVSSSKIVEDLTHRLNTLKESRAKAFAEMSSASVGNVSFVPAKEGQVTHSCVGGCNPADIAFDPLHDIDVCLKCHTRYNREVNNSLKENLSYSELKNADINIGGCGGYNPANHFSDIVGQFQGRRRSIAPKEVVDKIRGMCKKYRRSFREITPALCRKFLKQLQDDQNTILKYGTAETKAKSDLILRNPKNANKIKNYTDYYKHCPEISYRISNIPPPFLTPMQESFIFALFPMVVAGYQTTPRYARRAKDRRMRKTRLQPNNMNYLYVFYKECQLLGYNEFLPYIALPKSIDNINDNDENAWKHICKLWSWSYTSTR